MHYVWKKIAIIPLCFVMASCAPFAPDARLAQNTLPAAMPKNYPSQPLSAEDSATIAASKKPWWENFESADLNTLIEKSLSTNFDIVTAYAKLRQAQAVTSRATAGLFPTLNFDGGVDTQRTVQRNTSTDATTDTVNNGHNVGLAASFELDLWGRVRSEREAELLRTEATVQDLQSAAMTVAAEVADTWVSLLGNRRDLDVLEAQIAINEDLVELQTVRFNNGLGTSLELLQQKELLASSRAELPDLRQEAVALRNQLAILQGTLPGSGLAIDEKATLPPLAPMPEPGLPVQLLDARPDVAAAWARLAASDWDVSAAHANRYPALRLSASGVYQAAEASFLMTSWISSLAAALTMPLFDGGALAAEEARTRAQSDIEVQAYAKTVAVAIQEVDNALANDAGESRKLRLMEKQYEFASAAMIEARNSYLGGVSTFLNYITELKNVQTLERAIARQKTTVVRSRITLYRALGSLNFPVSLR